MRVQVKSVSDIAFIKYIIVDGETGKPVIPDEYLRPLKYAQQVADLINERLADKGRQARLSALILKDAKFWIDEANKPRPVDPVPVQEADHSGVDTDDNAGRGGLDGSGGVSGAKVGATRPEP